MGIYILCTLLGSMLVAARFLLAFFHWGGADKIGGHFLHGTHTLLALATLPLAGATGFGLAGVAARAGGLAEPLPFLCGVTAAVLVIVPVPLLEKLNARPGLHPGLRLSRTLRRNAVVREAIPAHHAGAGIIAVELPSGEVEVRAVSAANELVAGTPVVVQAIVDGETVEVAAEVDFKQIWRQAMPR
jgi:hypothetical protein